MWKNVNDMIQDLVQLNDATPGDEEPYQVLYKKYSIKESDTEPKKPEPFLDPKTGEVISSSEDESEGTSILIAGQKHANINALQASLELKNQLQMIRKLRANDKEVELYYGYSNSHFISKACERGTKRV